MKLKRRDITGIGRRRYLEGMDHRGRHCKVLVVDDEGLVRKLVAQVLKSVGYEIVGEANNGQMAIGLYKIVKPDIVILDLRMPIMNGFTTLEKILEIDENAKVIMLTNEKDKETVIQILKAGGKDYIIKPIVRKLLLEKLKIVRGLQLKE